MVYYSAIKNNEFMKFLDKLIELENIILSDITQLHKNTHGMHSLMNGFYSQMLQITRIQFTDHRKLNRKKDQSVGASGLLRRRRKCSQEQICR